MKLTSCQYLILMLHYSSKTKTVSKALRFRQGQLQLKRKLGMNTDQTVGFQYRSSSEAYIQ